MGRQSDDANGKRRKEADIVRLESERQPSGLFRHRLVKLIMELTARRRRSAS